jgi:aminoglycoside phosphotransferase (APT) family kinase protein
MSTIGHPLSDISNLLTPYFTARLDPSQSINVHPGFKPRATRGLPTPDEITRLYFSITSPTPRAAGSSNSLELSLSEQDQERQERDQRRELQWAQAFNIFRLAAICQGIAARQAGRQASSEQARRYADARGPLARFAWELVQSARSMGGDRPSRGRSRL